MEMGCASFLCWPLCQCRKWAWSKEAPWQCASVVWYSCLGTSVPTKPPILEVCGPQGEQLMGPREGCGAQQAVGRCLGGQSCFWKKRTLGISPERVTPPYRHPTPRSQGVPHLEAGRMGWGGCHQGKIHPPLYTKPRQ